MFRALSRGGIYLVFIIGMGITWLINKYAKQKKREIAVPDTAASTTADFLAALSAKDWHLRLWGAENLAKYPQVEAIPTLTKLLEDNDPDVREKSGEALAQLGTEASQAVIPLMQSRRLEVREAVVKVLASIADELSLRALSEAMVEDSSAWVRMPAAEAIGNQKDSRFHADLVKGLDDEHEEVYQAVKAALLALNTPEARTAVAMKPYNPNQNKADSALEEIS